tara:strand:+ start:56235 stop:57338 length:1104 start_codon:yes stop_codon:yes gene_type:complete
MIVAGGTGGHVMPALAVAEFFQTQGYVVHWLGTKQGIEHRLVPQNNIPISYINISGLRGKGLKKLLLAPFKILKAILQALSLLRKHQPVLVLTMGGYVSGPVGMAAWLLRMPLVVHEQNAIAGFTNKILARFAKRVFISYPNALPNAKHKSVLTGNPLRQILLQPYPATKTTVSGSEPDSKSKPLKILVFGGSQGALKLNQVIPDVVALFPKDTRPQIWHQSGKNHLAVTQSAYQNVGVAVKLTTFIDDMVSAYQWADIVICRSGALTVAEIAQMAKPCIFIPFPQAVDDHQTYNARYLSDEGAAILLPQSILSVQTLYQAINSLLDPDKRTIMAQKAKSLAKPQATQQVAEQCINLILNPTNTGQP